MNLAKRMSPSELPRERMVRDGIQALSLQELVAILLGTGTAGKSVLVLAQELVLKFGGIQGLLNASLSELMEVKGIGHAKAILLKAAFGIALRAAKERTPPQKKILTFRDVLEIAQTEIAYLKKEALLVILRDVKCRLIRHEVISIGTLSEVLVHPREVFQPAIRHGAYSLIVCHNHPSGDPTPSRADLALTRQLLACSKIVGITLTDHLIVSNEEYVSVFKYLNSSAPAL